MPTDEKCTMTDVQYGVKVFAYFDLNEDGTANFDRMDADDLAEAVREPYDELYLCKGCGDEFSDLEAINQHIKEQAE